MRAIIKYRSRKFELADTHKNLKLREEVRAEELDIDLHETYQLRGEKQH
jgi:hypothetical protein